MATLAQPADKPFWEKEVFHGVAAIMKEIQMFPQITEEPEDNLLSLEDVDEQPASKESPSPPSSKSSSSLFESIAESPPSIKDENSITGPIPKIVAEEIEVSNGKLESIQAVPSEDFTPPPTRTRMRSLSGGAYRLSPAPTNAARMRRQSGDDVLSATSPSRRTANAFLEAFRPRSKSDSKGKRPTLLTTLKNSIFSNTANHHHQQPRKFSLDHDACDTLAQGFGVKQLLRSGSETRGGPVSKMIDMFRGRSNSITIDQRIHMASTFGKDKQNTSREAALKDPQSRRRRREGRNNAGSLDFSRTLASYRTQVRSPEEEDALVGTFFRSFTTHSIVPYSVKVIVLDVNLLVEKALMILMENHVDAAPLWDGTKMHHIGMLTITDLVEVLNVFYSDPSMMDENFDLAQLRIKDWRRITNRQDDFITIDSDSSLENAVRELCDRKIHRLPIYESSSQTVVGIVSHHRILSFFNQYPRTFVKEPFLGNSEFLKKTLSEHRIGTYENLATIQMTTTVCEAVRLFIERRVSSLPVLKDKKCIKIFAKSDLVELASNRMYENRNLTVGDTLERREKECEPLTCLLTDTLKAVMIKLAETMAYRLVVVDADEAFLGIISVSDMMSFLVFRDPGTVLPSVNEVLSRLRRRSSDTEDKSSARVELPMTDEVMHGADSPDALVASLAALSTADTVEESLEPAQSEDQEDYARLGARPKTRKK